ncbi:hypothetical protein WJX84_003131, partial [Apatococcus fuscideae]
MGDSCTAGFQERSLSAPRWKKYQGLKAEGREAEKESSDLRFRIAALQEEVKDAKEAKALSAQVAEQEGKIKQQNTELASCYKGSACIAEELVKSNRQLQDVRDINKGQLRELEAERGQVQTLQAKRRELSQQVEEAREAMHAQSEELEVRLAEKNAAMAKMEQAETITRQLMARLEKDQVGQVDRMNEVMQSEEMVQAAKCRAKAIIKTAQAEGDRYIAKAQEEAILAISSSPPEAASPGRLSRRLSFLKAQLKRKSSSGADVSGVDAEEQQVAGLPQPYVLVPTKPTHSTSAHAGGCFGLTFT